MNNRVEVLFSIEIDSTQERWEYFYRVDGTTLTEIKCKLVEKFTQHTGLTGVPKGFRKTNKYIASEEKLEVILRDTQERFTSPMTATFKGLLSDEGTFTIKYYDRFVKWHDAYEKFGWDNDPGYALAESYPGHEYADQDDHHAEREREAYKEVGGDYYS